MPECIVEHLRMGNEASVTSNVVLLADKVLGNLRLTSPKGLYSPGWLYPMELDGAALSHGAMRIHPAERASRQATCFTVWFASARPTPLLALVIRKVRVFHCTRQHPGSGEGGTPPGCAAQSTRAVSEVCFVHRWRVAVGGSKGDVIAGLEQHLHGLQKLVQVEAGHPSNPV